MLKIGALSGVGTNLIPIVPSIAKKLIPSDFEIFIEDGIEKKSFFEQDEFSGVSFLERNNVITSADVLLLAWHELSQKEITLINGGAFVIGRFTLSKASQVIDQLKEKKVTVFDLDRVPRSSIAQSMDVLSSLASLSGYKATLEASSNYPGYFPMMTTAAGTVPPARVLVLGAGVAGLQAIATSKRLGAVVEAFDVRTAVREEVESLGAKFIEVAGSAEDSDAGGYAVEQTQEYQELQKQLIHEKAAKADVVITTANIPGRKAPLLVEGKTIGAMRPGSVVVDMATASGGNCEGSKDNETIVSGGVTIIGSSHLYEELPKEASRLLSTNIYHFLKFILKEGKQNIPWDHDILENTVIHRVQDEDVATD